jgi:hypothetical protein
MATIRPSRPWSQESPAPRINDGAVRWAIVASLLATAKLNHVKQSRGIRVATGYGKHVLEVGAISRHLSIAQR